MRRMFLTISLFTLSIPLVLPALVFGQGTVFVQARSQKDKPEEKEKKAPEAEPRSRNETRGTFTVFSRKGQKIGDKKRDTVVLWTSADIQENEEFGSLVVVSGDVNFYGKAKDLVVVGGRVVLHDGSRVEDSLVVVGGKLDQRTGAHVTEQVYFELPEHLPSWIAALTPLASVISSEGGAFLKRVVTAVLICLFGALCYLLIPNLMQTAERYLQTNPFDSGLWGFAGILLFVPGVLLLVVSIIGLLFVPLYFAVYGMLYLFIGYVMTANILGHYLPPRRSVVMPPLRMCYGVFILELISIIPFIGPLVIYSSCFLAAGAMLRTVILAIRNRTPSRSVA